MDLLIARNVDNNETQNVFLPVGENIELRKRIIELLLSVENKDVLLENIQSYFGRESDLARDIVRGSITHFLDEGVYNYIQKKLYFYYISLI